jgi:type VI secretion system protein VasD
LRRLKKPDEPGTPGRAIAPTQTTIFSIRFNGGIILLAGTFVMKRTLPLIALFVLPSLLAACAAAPFASGALQLLGLKAPAEVPDAQKPVRKIAIRLQAADNLNSDAGGRPLALVARIYKLRQNSAFEQAPYDSFLSAQKEKEVLGADLLEVREVMLIPGQRYETVEKVSREAYYVGVVALFRSPAQQRWRLAFEAGAAEKSGISIGAGACAITATADTQAPTPRCR